MNKKGQFYLISSIIIISVLFSLVSVYNFARVEKENINIQDLSYEIDYEISKSIDYAIFSQQDPKPFIDVLTDHYAFNKIDNDLVAIYGDGRQANISIYKSTESGEISISFGNSGGDFSFSNKGKNIINNSYVVGDVINVTILPSAIYRKTLGEGKIFYLILHAERDGENYITETDFSPNEES